jgi:hypothetical protein
MLNGSISGLLSFLITHSIYIPKIFKQMGTDIKKQFKVFGIKILGSSLYLPLNSFLSEFISSTIFLHPIDCLKTVHIYNNGHL